MPKYTECKTVVKQGKRRLEYVNNRRGTRLAIRVGERGGLSVKSRTSQSRRYIKSVCEKTNCDGKFWSTVKSMRKSDVRRKR